MMIGGDEIRTASTEGQGAKPVNSAPSALRRFVDPASDVPMTIIRDVVVGRGILRQWCDIPGDRISDPRR